MTHLAPSIVRGSKPRVDSPYISCSAAWPALLQTVSGSTSVAPMRLKKRSGKVPAISEQVPGVMSLQNGGAAIAGADRLEPAGDIGEGLIPADGLEAARALGADALQGARQAHMRIPPHAVVTDGTFAAERAAADVVIGIADDVDGAVRRRLHQHAAGVVAIPRAGGADRDGVAHGSCLQRRHCTSPTLSTSPNSRQKARLRGRHCRTLMAS